ncbi:MAG: hypothetical protein RL220_1397 [Bacteroidota bacterium]
MKNDILFNFIVGDDRKSIRVERSFNAPKDLVWEAWTDADILDQWWAPKPYRCETKSMNFVVNGQWHYCMVGPEGDRHWCLFDYEEIISEEYFSGIDAFCDEQAIMNETKPRVRWGSTFRVAEGNKTMVEVELLFNSPDDLEAIVKMGFREGFAMGLQNLDDYIAAQFYLRSQSKLSSHARVSTYVNFPGNTEQAFAFYKTVFGTDYINGLTRFGDLPPSPDSPPASESVRNMILHVELPLLGNHVLMGTDAPAEMGFSVVKGNNMHINLEPDSKTEADRIFNALAEGGEITMPIQDMFWGAYFGSVTDKFGINWMVNYQPSVSSYPPDPTCEGFT